jgi:serine/threonine protein kinase/tetratricopeptide (TPR) repeat protein
MDERAVLERYPLPIARGYRRFRNALEPRERHDAAFYLFEIHLKYLASIAISRYLSGEERDHRVNAALKGLARPSLGEWVRFLRECLKFHRGLKDPDPAVLAMAGLFESREARWHEAVRLCNALCSFLEEKPSEKQSVSLEMLLSELVAYRNRVLGHGAPLAAEHYRTFGELLGSAFPEVLEQSPFLTARRLVLFDSVQVEEGSRIECRVIEFMGLQPVRREAPLLVSFEDAPRKGVLYLLGDEDRLLLLDPLLAAHDEDVYFLNEAGGTPEYLSYSSGERYRPSDLGGAQGDLFARILGYTVDSSRLSRIADDLAKPDGSPPGALTVTDERRLGDYRILREVGRGAMGIVFEAAQESLGRRVALKVLPGTFALDPRRVERFRREARATARVHHPSIVPVYEVGEADGNHYYAMEYIDGPSLDRVLAGAREAGPERRRPGSSTASDAAYIARSVERAAELAEGLAQAHALGLVHRDVKPSNILLDRDGRWVLVDFGLVHESEAEALTRSGEMVGTLTYMSPEQVSRSQVDARADVYALGVTLYECLTLRPPYRGESDHEVQRAILFEEPVRPRSLNPRLHRDLETILLKALEKNPQRRYPSAAELAADLRRFLRYEPIHARAQSRWSRLARRAVKHKARVISGAVIVILLGVLGVLLTVHHFRERARLLASYEPTVLQAATRLQLAGLSLKWGAGYLAYMDRWPAQSRASYRGLTRDARKLEVEAAVRTLAQAAAVAPQRADAYYHRARGLLLLDRTRDAGAELDRTLERDPRLVPALILRAGLKDQQGDAAGAGTDREAAKAHGKEGWGEDWLEASAAMAEGRWSAGAEAYGKLLELDRPGKEPYLGFLVEARLGRGVAHLEAEEFQQAIEDFQEARALLPESHQPGLLLGKTYYLTARKKKAAEVFEEVFRRTRLKDDVALEVAGIHRAWHDYKEALRWLEKMNEGSFIRELERCENLTYHGRLDQAIEAGLEAVRLGPGEGSAYAALAQAYMRGGNLEKANELAQKSLDLAPENVWFRYVIARNILKDGAQIAAYREVIELDPGSPWAHHRLGEALYFGLGEKTESFAEVRLAIDLEPKNFVPYRILGRMLEAEGDHAEAARCYCRSIELNPTHSYAHGNLFALLRRPEKPAAMAAPIDSLVKRLERLLSLGADDTSLIFRTLALALIYHPTGKEAGRALRYARQGVEAGEGKDPGAFETLAEVALHAGEPRLAVTTLETAAELPHEARLLETKLAQCRKAALPDLPSRRSIDAALLALEDPAADRSLRDGFLSAGAEEDRSKLGPYLEARLLQRTGRHAEAVVKLRELAALDPGTPEVLVQLARSLRAAGQGEKARAVIRQALAGVSPHDKDFWDLWAATRLNESRDAPAEVLADLPSDPAAGSTATDLRWLLEQLAAGAPIRIRCGGEEYRSRDGAVWGRDRFFSAGNVYLSRAAVYSGEIAGTDDDPLYGTERWFPVDFAGSANYRLPLPRGSWRVTLHFAEIAYRTAGMRRFGVRIEGEETLKGFEPVSAGFATASQKVWTGPVKDGFLDIDFIHEVEHPKVSAIEIERVP